MESVHSDAEDEDARTVEPREVAPSSRNSVAGTENTENEAMTRYPLRRRQPNQLHPYLFDEYQYKTVLKNNPAAIIDVLRLQRRRANQPEDHYEEEYVEEESQQQTSDQNEEVEDQGGRTNPPAEPLPAFIDPLSESEDDSDELAKEARRVEREFRRREREERERERERQREEKEQKRRERERLREERAARKKPKRFPMNNASAHPESSSHVSWFNLVLIRVCNLFINRLLITSLHQLLDDFVTLERLLFQDVHQHVLPHLVKTVTNLTLCGTISWTISQRLLKTLQ